MAKKPAEPFRTKVRVKGTASSTQNVQSAVFPPTRSLMEALKEAGAKPEISRPASVQPADATEFSDETPPPPRVVRRVRHKPGRLAAAKLRQLARLREAAASLESLASGEIEEATVEIIRHDGKPSARQG